MGISHVLTVDVEVALVCDTEILLDQKIQRLVRVREELIIVTLSISATPFVKEVRLHHRALPRIMEDYVLAKKMNQPFNLKRGVVGYDPFFVIEQVFKCYGQFCLI